MSMNATRVCAASVRRLFGSNNQTFIWPNDIPRIMIQSQCINSTGGLFVGVIIQEDYQRHKERYKLQIAECQEYAMRQSRSIQSDNRIPSLTSPSPINFFPPLRNSLHSSHQFLVHSNLFLNLAFFSDPFVYFCTSIDFSF